MVKFKFHLYLKNFAKAEEKELTLPGDGMRLDVGSYLKSLGIPLEEVGIIVVNGKWQDIDYILRDGDSVEVFPVYLGG